MNSTCERGRHSARALEPYPDCKDSGVQWLGKVPAHWEVRRLRTVAEMRVSNLDKHTKEGEFPVRLCNYVDVYKNDRITQAMPFMNATASPEEVKRSSVTGFRVGCQKFDLYKFGKCGITLA